MEAENELSAQVVHPARAPGNLFQKSQRHPVHVLGLFHGVADDFLDGGGPRKGLRPVERSG